MKKSFLSSIGKLALIVSVSFSAVTANAYTNDTVKKTVLDKSGNPVVSGPMGENCVITKWDGSYGECSGDYAEPKRVMEKPVAAAAKGEKQNRKFIVFFDFDSNEITNSAGSVLNALARTISGSSDIDYDLVGYTDSSGSSDYNNKLSQRRANAVKQRLVQMGAISRDISSSWKGESGQLVDTDDGVKQPKNRRVEIDVEYTK